MIVSFGSDTDSLRCGDGLFEINSESDSSGEVDEVCEKESLKVGVSVRLRSSV